ncbi:hypothetical protein RCH14_004471 [Massilia sp. MP_M2]|uniref:hypothetical protein n=1 Tax=Massilia sp. MP_M2 TaxID=3071713 RepID=UPI00319E396D
MTDPKNNKSDANEANSRTNSLLVANREYSRNHRDKLLQLGKVQLKAFIDPSTRDGLKESKKQLGLTDKATLGETIDALWKFFSENNKKN